MDDAVLLGSFPWEQLSICQCHGICLNEYRRCTQTIPLCKCKSALELSDGTVIVSPTIHCAISRQGYITTIKKWLSNPNETPNTSWILRRPFTIGVLSNIWSGRSSIFRSRVLGVKVAAIRATLLIDSTLSPNQVIIPKQFIQTKLHTRYVLVNRSPSINDTAIYSCKAMFGDLPYIIVNGYILDGLHADQDGDDLSVFIVPADTSYPSFDVNRAVRSIKSISWKYGFNNTLSNTPRYQFSQYQRLIVARELQNLTHPIWKDLAITETNVNDLFSVDGMFHSQVDSALTEVSNVIRQHQVLVNASNVHKLTEDIVNFKVKGSGQHLKLFQDMLDNKSVVTVQHAIDGFNKCVNSSANMGQTGFQTFVLLDTESHIVSNTITNTIGPGIFSGPSALFPTMSVKTMRNILKLGKRKRVVGGVCKKTHKRRGIIAY